MAFEEMISVQTFNFRLRYVETMEFMMEGIMDGASDTNVMISRGRVWQSNCQRCGIRVSY